MIIIDTKLKELEKSGKSIGVALIGAGFMARGIATQIHNYTPGMRLIGVANRTVARVTTMLADIHATDADVIVTDDPITLMQRPDVDVVVEATGSMEYGTMVILEAFKAGKHVVSMNAEIDATLGHILRDMARAAGVVYTLSDGDQPGAELNLYRYVRGLGLDPVMCGNIKGLHDPTRTPTTQAGFAKKWGQNAHMVTSFADGTKISFEQACVANATGMGVVRRGMLGPTVATGSPIEESVNLFSLNDLTARGHGVVDYVVGANPNGGVFVLAALGDDHIQQHYLNYYKMGDGPLYCFYAPYHLCHFETPASIARAYFFRDETLVALGDKPMVEVVTVAKKDMEAGDSLDAFGGYTMYGVCENSPIAREQNLLPIGLAEGATLKRAVKKDECLTFDDVELAPNSLVHQLWSTQHGV